MKVLPSQYYRVDSIVLIVCFQFQGCRENKSKDTSSRKKEYSSHQRINNNFAGTIIDPKQLSAFTQIHPDKQETQTNLFTKNKEPQRRIPQSFKERHQRLFIFSPDMYEKLLEHRETIERRIAVINKQTRQHGDDGDDRGEGHPNDGRSSCGDEQKLGIKESSTIQQKRGEGVSLFFDSSRCSVLIDADEEEKISKAKRELCQLFPTIPMSSTRESDILPSSSGGLNKNTDELGLSDLLPSLLLETDMKNELLCSSRDGEVEINNFSGGSIGLSERPLTYAASWDVSSLSPTTGSNVSARRCHSSSGMMSSAQQNQQNQQHETQSRLIHSQQQQSHHRSLLQNQQHPLHDHVNLLLQSPLPPELCISSSLATNPSTPANIIVPNQKSSEDGKSIPVMESQQVFKHQLDIFLTFIIIKGDV